MKIDGMIEPAAGERWIFDADAAERPVRFIEKFCENYQGAHAGKPFHLHPIQKKIVRDLYGWKAKDTGLRRFTDCYFEGAVGCGKSPLLAGIGLYGLIGDREPAAQVWSIASTYGQARVVFETAKKFAQGSTELEKRLRIVEREIRHPGSASKWTISSGKGPGAGCQPSLILADEMHEWRSSSNYAALRDRMFKRSQPLLIGATNTPETDESFCGQLRRNALKVLAGEKDAPETLYPVIWAAPAGADPADPAAWRAANPLIGVTMTEAKIALAYRSAASSVEPDALAKFGRLYAGIRPANTAGRWLDLAEVDEVSAPFNASSLAECALYIGVDLSEVDDLCAVVCVWIDKAGKAWAESHFWTPEATAARYEEREAIPYAAWAKAGAITLVREPTISDRIRRQIAEHILARSKLGKLKAICYDRYRADVTISQLERAGKPCIAIAQGYSVSPGCCELERRIKERSIQIAPNPVFRFCASNVEVTGDKQGNIWPVKPNAKADYAGKRGAKIDAISALVTALTEARKAKFSKTWTGSITSVSKK